MNTAEQHSGVLYIHALRPSLIPHLQWSLAQTLGGNIEIGWREQPQKQGYMATTLDWVASAGTETLLVSTLRELTDIWFELSDRGSAKNLPGWFMYTPELGIFYTPTDHSGNFLISEDRVRVAYEKSMGDPAVLMHQFSTALGEAWNQELEPLRQATAECTVIQMVRSS